MILDASKKLTLKDSAYKKAVQFYVVGMLQEDIKSEDITTDKFVPKKTRAVMAEITAKEAGIMAGMQEAEWLLKKAGIKVLKAAKDGKAIKKGDVVLKMVGHANNILKVERTLLNLLQRMSGIATKTNALSKKLPRGIKLLGTRKTFWGPLDKRAVSLGGGATHRLNLGDAILVKENHITLTTNFEKSLKKIFKVAKKTRFVEIEVETALQAEVLQGYFEKYKDKYKLKGKVVIMLDNFTPAKVKALAPGLKKSGMLVEVSGGITEANIKSYAKTGVAAISSGAITNKAPAIDLSLRILA